MKILYDNDGIIPSVNLHLTCECNYHCGFCFAKYASGIANSAFQIIPGNALIEKNDPLFSKLIFPSGSQSKFLDFKSAVAIVHALADAGISKLTIAGGEPLLYNGLVKLCEIASQRGLTTMLITNGYHLSDKMLNDLCGKVKWIGLSIDSINHVTNIAIGRANNGHMPLSGYDYYQLCHKIKSLGFRLKVNTVANRFNIKENLSGFIREVMPERWKIFQVIFNKGVNDRREDDFSISRNEFWDFFLDNYISIPGIKVIPESEDLMRESYLMIDPSGRFYDNSDGRHNYSRKILDVGIETALKDVKFDHALFQKRGGLYNY